MTIDTNLNNYAATTWTVRSFWKIVESTSKWSDISDLNVSHLFDSSTIKHTIRIPNKVIIVDGSEDKNSSDVYEINGQDMTVKDFKEMYRQVKEMSKTKVLDTKRLEDRDKINTIIGKVEDAYYTDWKRIDKQYHPGDILLKK